MFFFLLSDARQEEEGIMDPASCLRSLFLPGILVLGVCVDEVCQLEAGYLEDDIVRDDRSTEIDRKYVCVPSDGVNHEGECEVQVPRYNVLHNFVQVEDIVLEAFTFPPEQRIKRLVY